MNDFLPGQQCSLDFFVSRETDSISLRNIRQGQVSAGPVGVINYSRCDAFIDANVSGDAMKIFLAELRQIGFDSEGKMTSTYLHRHISSITDQVPSSG